jgi:hypothetical protein
LNAFPSTVTSHTKDIQIHRQWLPGYELNVNDQEFREFATICFGSIDINTPTPCYN